MTRISLSDIQSHLKRDMPLLISIAKGRLLNLQRSRAFEVGEKHYDIPWRVVTDLVEEAAGAHRFAGDGDAISFMLTTYSSL
jgi:hypothetical protein